MEEKNPNNQNLARDDFDRVLDAVLTQYRAVEPRPGLEERILANLRVEEIRPHQTWRPWSLAVAAVTIVVVLALAWRWSKPSIPQIVNRIPDSIQSQPPKQEATNQDVAKTPRRRLRPRMAVRFSMERKIAAALPKLDQFPSPHPLSEEEKLLASYVAQFQEEAVIVARVRTEEAKADRERELQEDIQGSDQNSRAR